MSTATTAITTAIPVEVSGLSGAEQQLLSEIMADVKRSLDGLRRAAGKWVEMPAKARAKVIEQTQPNLRDFWTKLDAVGAGTLHPQLALVSGLAGRYLGKLDIGEQERFLREGVPVVSVSGRRHDVRLVDVVQMSEDQRKLAFRTSGTGTVTVRTEDEQKALLAEQAARRVLAAEAKSTLKRVERVGWSVEGGRVYVKPDRVKGGLTKQDLVKMVKDLES